MSPLASEKQSIFVGSCTETVDNLELIFCLKSLV